VTDVRLGFIPLTDCAPLAVAQTLGLFAAEGIEVTLEREASWATIRDKVAVGALDGAHMLAPMALAASLGLGAEPSPLIAPLSLNLNGGGITVSRAVAEDLRRLGGDKADKAQALAGLVGERRAAGAPPLTFAVVFPYSIHNYLLRYWLADAGIDPDRDVRLVVTPPPRTAEQLRSGAIDGFCVGAPWNAIAVAEGAGEIVALTSDVWRAGPDKVLALGEGWAAANPEAVQALLRALLRAGDWADEPANRRELTAILARPEYVGAPASAIAHALSFGPQGIVFQRHAAGFPWRSHALWFLSQMLRWGQIGPGADLAAAAGRVYRPDLFRTAAAAVGAAAPQADLKVEGAHTEGWSLPGEPAPIPMPVDIFCDGRRFDPADALGYAAGFAITRTKVGA